MRIADMNWQDVQSFLAHDDRCVLPLGCVEQHGPLSLCVDAILAERIAVEAAAPLRVPVYPVMPYSPTPSFAAFPGTVTLRLETMAAIVTDILHSLHRGGFRRVLILNGHGGNTGMEVVAQQVMIERPDFCVKMHHWYRSPRVSAAADLISPDGSHANWFENFAWTRLAHASTPDMAKPPINTIVAHAAPPAFVRAMLGDGTYGGAYQTDEAAMDAIWQAGVEDAREALETNWPALSVRAK